MGALEKYPRRGFRNGLAEINGRASIDRRKDGPQGRASGTRAGYSLAFLLGDSARKVIQDRSG